MIDKFLTLDMLIQFPIMIIVVGLITQFTKDLLDKFKHVPTKYFVYLYSLALLLITGYFKEGLDSLKIFLAVINGIVVAFGAMKGFEQIDSMYKALVKNNENNS